MHPTACALTWPSVQGLLEILSPGDEMENHMDYSACREFTGQSTLTFDTPSQPSGSISATSDPVRPAFALPPGQPFKLAFTELIDTAVVAAGNPFRAKLTTAILSGSAQVLVPNGAIVLCRIMKAERLYGKNRAFVLGVKTESIIVGETPRPSSPRRTPVHGGSQKAKAGYCSG